MESKQVQSIDDKWPSGHEVKNRERMYFRIFWEPQLAQPVQTWWWSMNCLCSLTLPVSVICTHGTVTAETSGRICSVPQPCPVGSWGRPIQSFPSTTYTDWISRTLVKSGRNHILEQISQLSVIEAFFPPMNYEKPFPRVVCQKMKEAQMPRMSCAVPQAARTQFTVGSPTAQQRNDSHLTSSLPLSFRSQRLRLEFRKTIPVLFNWISQHL